VDEEPKKMRWSDAWQRLVYEHSPFRAADSEGFQELLDQLRALEQLFLSTSGLHAYVSEWDEPEPASPTPSSMTRHAAAIQLQLMEDVFYSLRLDRHANAPDNRGWMNLFKTWTRSPTFREHAKQLRPTFSRQFFAFYWLYIESWEIDVPVPHPWDVPPVRQHYEKETKVAIERCRKRKGKGIFLDPGRMEAGAHGAYEPLPVKEQQHGTAPLPTAQESPAATSTDGGVEDSSKTTD
jgi:hypothetical protein